MTLYIAEPGADIPAGPWPYVMLLGGQQYAADHAGDLVAVLVKNYPATDDADADEAATVRYEAAVQFATVIQAAIIEQAQRAGTWTPVGSSDEDLTALMGSRLEPFVGNWSGPLPLVLVRTDYEPYTARELPTGDGLLFIDPYTDVTLLSSLQQLGVIQDVQVQP